jgi:hypothetical protein
MLWLWLVFVIKLSDNYPTHSTTPTSDPINAIIYPTTTAALLEFNNCDKQKDRDISENPHPTKKIARREGLVSKKNLTFINIPFKM